MDIVRKSSLSRPAESLVGQGKRASSVAHHQVGMFVCWALCTRLGRGSGQQAQEGCRRGSGSRRRALAAVCSGADAETRSHALGWMGGGGSNRLRSHLACGVVEGRGRRGRVADGCVRARGSRRRRGEGREVVCGWRWCWPFGLCCREEVSQAVCLVAEEEPASTGTLEGENMGKGQAEAGAAGVGRDGARRAWELEHNHWQAPPS